MADHRPDVYEDDDGTIVYRASAVGRCERALLHARIGRSRSPRAATLQKAMDESAALEDPILDALAEQYRIVVTDQQTEIELDVEEGIVVRGHIDGFAVTDRPGLVEVKAFGDGYFSRWRKEGMAGFSEYVAQFHLYCAGLVSSGVPDLTGGWFVVGAKSDTGHLLTDPDGKPIVRFEWVDYKRAVVAKMFARIRRVEELYARMQDGDRCEAEAPCPAAYGCPYWTLHDGDSTPVEIHDQLNRLIIRHTAAKLNQAGAKAQCDAIAEEIEQILQAEGVTSKRVLIGVDQAATISLVPPTTTSTVDRDAAASAGIDLTPYLKESTRRGYVRITAPKERET